MSFVEAREQALLEVFHILQDVYIVRAEGLLFKNIMQETPQVYHMIFIYMRTVRTSYELRMSLIFKFPLSRPGRQ